MEILKLTGIFVIILLLIKLRFKVGLSIFIGGIVLGFLSGQNIPEVGHSIITGLTAWGTIRLVLVVSIISTLGAILKNQKITDRLVSGVENVSGSIKTTMVLCPAIIGLMPMPGGALLSAPLVSEACRDEHISADKLTAINYWFRHVFEFFWPIYPGIILSSAILDVKISTIALWQMPFSAAFILGGLIFLIFPLKNVSKFTRRESLKSSWMNIIRGVWPILLVVSITLIFSVDILISLVISFVIFLMINRPGAGVFLRSLKEGASFSIISLVVGVMVFQAIISDSGAALAMANQIASAGLPAWVVITVSCLIIGLLAGIVTAYVGIVYPILINLLILPEPNFANIVLAYAAGLIGVMISPLHLCLILTRDYYKSSLTRIYPMILGPALFVSAVVAVFLVLGYGR